jgi:hypothetical protein
MTGSAMHTRLQQKRESTPQEQTIWETGATVTGPFLLLYALWILETAKKRGITQLCFLARDAWFPMRAVEKVLSARGETNLKIHYIHGSRGTYLALKTGALDENFWEALTKHGSEAIRTLDGLASAFIIPNDELFPHWQSLGFTEDDFSRPLDDTELARIKEEALREGPLGLKLQQGLGNHRASFHQYLENQHFDFSQATALIDTGWTTRSHAPLYEYLTSGGCSNLSLFYIALLVPKPAVPPEALETFLFDESQREGSSRWNMYFPRPFETLLFADHGRTLRFNNHSGEARPVLSSCENEEFIDRYFTIYGRGITAFLDDILVSPIDTSEQWNFPIIAERLIARFWLKPTREEARVWSSMQWEWDPQGRVRYSLARPFRWGDARAAFAQQRLPECYPQFWIAGSEALTRRWKAKSLRAVASLSRRGRRLAKCLPAPVSQPLRALLRHLVPTPSSNY